ncbi:BIG GRAIN 1-like protein A [Tanacetum coccineum]
MAQMYNWDKSHKEDKPRKNGQIPSFSSTLLDEIYRSIDGGDEKFGEFKVRKPKVAKKPSRGKSVEDEEIASFRRACLVEKWMEMKANEKVVVARHGPPTLPEFDRKGVLDNDPLFFSSGSSSSDSSFGWHSEAEVVKPKPSCFGPLKGPKHVKTSVSPRSAMKKQNEVQLFDDDQINNNDHSGLIRSKTRALKIYASLKKVKQPISPGGRLTTFLNTLFTNGHTKKPKDSGFEERTQTRMERKSKSTNVSTCSSATSYSRSCLNKNTPSSRDQLNNGFRRTVRFEDHQVSRPCGVKNIPPPTFSWARTEKLSSKELSTKYDDKKFNFDDEDDDMASDSSSDLFELDHLAILRNEKYCEELPVYETTHLGTNRAIAGLVC